jgi:hypothetical protein
MRNFTVVKSIKTILSGHIQWVYIASLDTARLIRLMKLRPNIRASRVMSDDDHAVLLCACDYEVIYVTCCLLHPESSLVEELQSLGFDIQ